MGCRPIKRKYDLFFFKFSPHHLEKFIFELVNLLFFQLYRILFIFKVFLVGFNFFFVMV